MKQEFCFSFYENLASIHTIEYQWSGVRTTYEKMVGRIFALQKKEGFKAYSEKRCIIAYPRAGITLKLCDYAFPTVYVCINPRILSGDDHSYLGIFILNLQPYYDAAPEEYKNALNADAMKDLMTNPEGTCWGLPFTANCQLLYRNLTVLEACGIDTSKRPETMDELLEQFAIVQENGYDVLPNLTASDWVTSAFVCGNPDLKVGWENGETTITAEALEPGYELLKEVGQYSAAYTFLDQAATDAFTSDKLAFTVHGPFLNPNLEAAAQENSNFKYDAIPMPSQVAGGPYSASYGNEWLGVVDSGDQGRNDAAAGFLMYITDTEQMKTFCREMGRPVMNNEAMDEIANDPESPWLLGVCNEIVNNCVNQAVPFRCDMMWETGCADSMFGLWDGSLTDAKAAAEDSIAMINENA